MVTSSSRGKVTEKLVDVNRRWKSAEKLLGPAIEFIPQLPVVPVICFVIGLFDNIFSSIHRIHTPLVPLISALRLSLLIVVGTAGFLLFTILHASVWADTSPFQSTVARSVRRVVEILKEPTEYHSYLYSRTYHEVVQATHDDETLDKAAAALEGVMKVPTRAHYRESASDLDKTLHHLLSPEASIRCNHTAAQAIVHLNSLLYYQSHFNLMPPLVDATRRSASYRPFATLWSSTYLKACAVIASAYHPEHPPVVCILGSAYMKMALYRPTSLCFNIFFSYLHTISPDGSVTPAFIKLFEPEFIGTLHTLISVAVYFFDHEAGMNKQREIVLSLLIQAKTPVAVLTATRKLIAEETTEPEISLRLATAGCVIQKFFGPSTSDLRKYDSLVADLCSDCILVIKKLHEIPTWIDMGSTVKILWRVVHQPKFPPIQLSAELAWLKKSYKIPVESVSSERAAEELTPLASNQVAIEHWVQQSSGDNQHNTTE